MNISVAEQEQNEDRAAQDKRAAANIKLAAALGALSVGIYLVYILWNFL